MKKTLLIYGPTATGKTDLALKFARKFNGELISADSRQVYKYLDIGTGKVQPWVKVEKHHGFWIVDGVKVHGFDLVDPGENFTVADFVKFAKKKHSRIHAVHKLPIVVGGTGFYIKSLIEGIDTIGISADKKLRSQLEKLSTDTLFNKLRKVNPNRARSMNDSDQANPRRLIRAIEIAIHKHSPSVHLPSNPVIEPSKFLLIYLTAPNQYLYNRADHWLAERIKNGLIDEVKKLIDKKVNPDWLESLGLEYRWMTRLVLGRLTQNQAQDRLRGDIHDFIRRQKTYMKQFKNAKIFDISKTTFKKELEKLIATWYNQKNGRF